MTAFALVLFHPDGDSILLRDGTWIGFSLLVSRRRDGGTVDVQFFETLRAARAAQRSWSKRYDIGIVPIRKEERQWTNKTEW